MEEIVGRELKRWEVVHHINGDTLDNRPENLQLMTLWEHSRLHMGTKAIADRNKEMFSGEKASAAKLTAHKVCMLRVLVGMGISPYNLAETWGVDSETIRQAAKGITWRSVKFLLDRV